MSQKFNYDFVKKFFLDHGCELLSDVYVNNETPLSYICSCGNVSKIRFSSFRKGSRCQKCKAEKLRDVFSFNFAEVSKYFEDQGCKLLSSEYINSSIPMPYICSCGNESKISFNAFKSQKSRCKKCSIKKTSEKQRLPFEEIKKCFEDEGCKLLATEYVNNSTPMSYICKCGNESKICYANFKARKRCMKCSGNEQPSYNYVKQFFEDEGCKLLATEYVNNHTPMTYICKCGQISKVIWSSFQNGQKCKQCGINKTKEKLKLSFEEVKKFFEDRNCKLLATEYVNNSTPMPYICSCGNKATIKFTHFQRGRNCKQCGIAKMQNTQKLSFIEVQKYFEKQNCKLLATEYVNNSTPMPFICSCGNKATIRLCNFQKGQRCTNCKPRSKGEIAVSKWLDFNNLIYEAEYVISELNNKRFDFLAKDSFIEFHGKQHYMPFSFGSKQESAMEYLLNCIKSDWQKLEYCLKAKKPLLIIPYWELNHIDDILFKYFSGQKISWSSVPKDVVNYAEKRKKIRTQLNILEPEILYGIISEDTYAKIYQK